MITRLREFWERLRRDRGKLKATVLVDFYPNKEVTPLVTWEESADRDGDATTLALFLYARILFELAELNDTRAAKELMAFLSQVVKRVLAEGEQSGRPRLPLGELRLEESPPPEPPARSYRALLFQHQDGQFRLDFKGTLGKEGVYLPATYVVFLQHYINSLPDEALTRLARCLKRLHAYYKFRRDFWDSTALSAGPAFALGTEALKPEEAEMEG